MDENPEAVSKPLNLCQECNSNPFKYKCPGCSFRSCSLPCVNSHKQRTGCTGKRSLSAVISMSQFDDNLLVSDYNMLEDVKRVADSAQRMRVKLCGYSNFKLPFPLKSLRNAAASRRTKLLFLFYGMSKRQSNRTYYNHRKKFIAWTIEWRFHSTDVVLMDHGVHECSPLSSVIEKHLKPGPWHHPLRQFCDEPLDSLKLFIRKYPKGPKSPFRQLNMREPVRQQLVDITILEYPVIHVFLPSHKCDFDIINDSIQSKTKFSKAAPLDELSPQGVVFKEEEFEDVESADPHVLDLTSHIHENRESKNVPKELVQCPPTVEGPNGTDSVPSAGVAASDNNSLGRNVCIEELADIGDLDFDFEPTLVDVYADLIADTHPSEFLDFDGMLPEQKDLDCGAFLMDEELEEGEIA